jgi:hypothetical protein
MRLNFYEDPGHGWLAVPLPLLDKLGIIDQISTYSYMRGMLAHLEEDCDYALFARAMNDAGRFFTVKHHHTDNRSRIRTYCHFNAGVARRWMAEAQLSLKLQR